MFFLEIRFEKQEIESFCSEIFLCIQGAFMETKDRQLKFANLNEAVYQGLVAQIYFDNKSLRTFIFQIMSVYPILV